LNGVETLPHLLSPATLVPFLLGAIALTLFIRVERQQAEPLLDLSLFNHHRFRYSVLLASLQSIILFGCILLIPLWMQNTLG
ncbi:MAG TPA: MFS transporter, partial [Halomonas sp.]|nr:MFS transporter [Halomonas sp.]